MKQLVILSGKGGAGKTSLAAAFAHLALNGPFSVRAVLVDADVDAANLELVLRPERLETHDFTGGLLAVIDPQLCNACAACERACRFDAILPGVSFSVDPIACEGCAACVYQCPEEAILMQPQTAGQWYHSESRYGPLFHADLKPAQENSGKLVTLVKQQARLAALDGGHPLLVVDGPPGIGCPVISALSGADLVLIVTEPSASGLHDMKRIIRTAAHFRLPILVCINKADICLPESRLIEAYCRDNGFELAGEIPFDHAVTQAMIRSEPVTAFDTASPTSQAVIGIWKKVIERLGLVQEGP
jgi:MinD superfamily P-loop ATPase